MQLPRRRNSLATWDILHDSPVNNMQASIDPHDILLEEAKAGRTHGLEAILEQRSAHNFDINRTLDSDFLSPLCLACAGGHEDAALFLIRTAGADVNNAFGAAAAVFDAAQGYPRAASGDRLIFNGAGGGGERFGSAPATPLMLAIEAGLERVVVELIARGARVDTRRAIDGWTALHVCAWRGHALIMRSLLAAPLADPGTRTARLETPLSIACSNGHLAIADMLLDVGSEQADNIEGTMNDGAAAGKVVQAVGAGNGGIASSRLTGSRSRGARRHAEERTWSGRTPLHRAAARGHTEIVLRLLIHGVSADPVDSRRATPLILAARGGHVGAAVALVKQGRASVAASTRESDTALHASAGVSERGGVDVVRLLLGAGADVHARNALGSTGQFFYFLRFGVHGSCPFLAVLFCFRHKTALHTDMTHYL